MCEGPGVVECVVGPLFVGLCWVRIVRACVLSWVEILKRCIRSGGGAPSPNAPRPRNLPLKKSAKSHSAPLQPTPDDTPSRRCAPLQPVLPFIDSSFRELPLMTPAHLAEPLPASAVPA